MSKWPMDHNITLQEILLTYHSTFLEHIWSFLWTSLIGWLFKKTNLGAGSCSIFHKQLYLTCEFLNKYPGLNNFPKQNSKLQVISSKFFLCFLNTWKNIQTSPQRKKSQLYTKYFRYIAIDTYFSVILIKVSCYENQKVTRLTKFQTRIFNQMKEIYWRLCAC